MRADEEEEEDLTGFTAPPGLDLELPRRPDPVPAAPDDPHPAGARPARDDHAGSGHAAGDGPADAGAAARGPPARARRAGGRRPGGRGARGARAGAPAAAPSRINELNGLDDGAKIHQLLAKVDELLGARACVVQVGAPYRLRGGMKTIEVRFTVRERANSPVKVEFVAHYHPDASKARPGSAYASQWHLKKWTNAGGVRVDSMTDRSHPNLFPLVPKFGAMKRLNFNALPDTYPLYKPR